MMRECGHAAYQHMDALTSEADARLTPMADRQAVAVWGWLTIAAHGLADDDMIAAENDDEQEFDVPVAGLTAWDEHDSDELAPY